MATDAVRNASKSSTQLIPMQAPVSAMRASAPGAIPLNEIFSPRAAEDISRFRKKRRKSVSDSASLRSGSVSRTG